MEPVVVAALLAAALLHASWHAMIKASGDKEIGLAGMNVVSATVAIAFLPFVSPPPPSVWGLLALSVLFHNAYKLALARLYRLGDLSLGHPVARGLTPIFAALLGLALLGEVPALPQWTGIALVSAGLVVLASGSGRPSLAAVGAAALVSLLAATYAVIDAKGVRLSDWMGYTAWLMVFDGAVFIALTAGMRGGRLWQALSAAPWQTLISGILGVASFGVFLWALGRGAVGGVVAVRETSALFAVLIGVVVLKERLTGRRVLALTLVFGGVVIPVLG